MAERTVLSADDIAAAVEKIAQAIVNNERGTEGLALVGIRTRGVPLAERLLARIKELRPETDGRIAFGTIDITLYRDDLDEPHLTPVVHGTELDFQLDGRRVILVDDVCYTGRTVRAALEQLFSFGRPRAVELAVLVDRGLRELPICPDHTGVAIQSTHAEKVKVKLREIDEVDGAVVAG
jgi:pyrimidine operon attenuation protein/uracil phosphoribosyltransferase